MDYNPYGFEDIFRACGYTRNNDGQYNYKADFNDDSQSENTSGLGGGSENGKEEETSGKTQWNQFTGFDFNCDDIPFGFQQMYPQLFVIIGEIIGNAVAGRLPLNVQDAFGNWLQLVGQVILTYNAQQQYFQGGPGRYFSTIYYNVSNPFCPDPFKNYRDNKNCTCDNKEEKKNNKKSNKKSKVSQKDISRLHNNINELVKEINSLRYELDSLNEKIEQH